MSEEIAVHHSGNVGLTESAGGQQVRQALQIVNGIQILRRLFGAKASVQIRAESDVKAVSS
jgi:hypothetical protein